MYDDILVEIQPVSSTCVTKNWWDIDILVYCMKQFIDY